MSSPPAAQINVTPSSGNHRHDAPFAAYLPAIRARHRAEAQAVAARVVSFEADVVDLADCSPAINVEEIELQHQACK